MGDGVEKSNSNSSIEVELPVLEGNHDRPNDQAANQRTGIRGHKEVTLQKKLSRESRGEMEGRVGREEYIVRRGEGKGGRKGSDVKGMRGGRRDERGRIINNTEPQTGGDKRDKLGFRKVPHLFD